MQPFLLNDLAPSISLDGEWEFQLAQGPPQRIPVPAAWEAHTADKITPGPAVYRRTFTLPESEPNARLMLEAGALSFEAEVRVNGQPAGAHRGMWAPFQVDITPYVQMGDNLLEIEVWKPGGRTPVREALAGFLPDVALAFGGLWQPVRLRAMGLSAFSDLKVLAYGGGWLDVQGRVARLGERRRIEILIEAHDQAGRAVARAHAPLAEDQTFSAHLEAGGVERWRPDGEPPALYNVAVSQVVRGVETARVQRRTGFRTCAAAGSSTLLNGAPLHLRGVLDWGWQPEQAHPDRAREAALQMFAQARALGFNLIKLCLHVPGPELFEAADEAGMLLWLEMPLWQPSLTAAARALALAEYHDVFRRLHHHPSIAIVSLGCELNAEADAEFLRSLSQLARAFFPNALHCDNSGSAEAYGGAPAGLADFHDYHFYAEPHFFAPLVDHFSRPYLPPQPWLFGEFCDADTLRDFSRLDPAAWWLAEPLRLDRDDLRATRDYRERFSRAGVRDEGAALTRAARPQATAVRKFVLEATRARFPSGGYVVSGWRDTPITTSGIVDDALELKFEPYEWQQFNAARVLLIDRERRRAWVTGGDRPAPRDPFTWRQGERLALRLLLSNGAEAVEGAHLTWELSGEDGAALAQGAQPVGALPGAALAELAALDAPLPETGGERLQELRLRVELAEAPGGGVLARNTWTLWAAPAAPAAEAQPGVARALSVDLLERARAGAGAAAWLGQPDERCTRPVPFWREAIHVFEPHALWERVPQPGYADMRFFSVATDFALDLDALRRVLGEGARLTPVWRRFDARQMTWSEYVVEAELGAGRLIVTTLRLAGGLGAQPQSGQANPMGAWLLESLLALAGG